LLEKSSPATLQILDYIISDKWIKEHIHASHVDGSGEAGPADVYTGALEADGFKDLAGRSTDLVTKGYAQVRCFFVHR
jgi:hypothetical protein